MRYQDPKLRNKLAAEYVLGTLRGLARARFQRLMRHDPELRQLVDDWEKKLMPLAHAVPEVTPPARVWERIQDRIASPKTATAPAKPGFLQSLALWRSLAVFASVAAIALGVVLTQLPGPEPVPLPPRMQVVVMSDKEKNPRIAVSWPAAQPGLKRTLQVRVMGHEEMAPDTSWELWCLPAGGKNPISMGLLTTDQEQRMQVAKGKWPDLDSAEGMAMSVEPKGGSPTGLPTGPVIYAGPRIEI